MTGAPRRSPDGTVEVTFSAMSEGHHWVYEPAVVRVRDGRVLVDLGGTHLDPFHEVRFPAPNRVRLVLVRYPHASIERYDLLVDVEAETFSNGGGEPDRPLAELHEVVRELRLKMPDVYAADLAAATCPMCGGHLRRDGVSAFDTTQPFRCRSCERVWYGGGAP